MNSVYVETASRIYAAAMGACLSGSDSSDTIKEHLADIAAGSFVMADAFMIEYRKRCDQERAEIQQALQQNPGGVMGADPYEIRARQNLF